MRLPPHWDYRLLLYFLSCSVSKVYADGVTWLSPTEGDSYESGDIIVASWKSQENVISPSLTLCADNDGEQCGSAIWPTVTQSSGSKSSASMIVPNITAEGSFYIKMKSDSGEIYSSPAFDLYPTSLYETSDQGATDGAQQPLAQPPQPTTANATISQAPATETVPASTVPIRPTPSVNPNSYTAVKSTPNSLALAIPLTMLGMACLGAFGYAISRRRRQKRKNGGNVSGLQPTLTTGSGALSQATSRSTISLTDSDHKNPNHSSFFNISLNKAEGQLSQVEKAVVATINEAAVPMRNMQRPQDRRSVDPYRVSLPRRELRRVRSDRSELDDYMAPPPRSWQGYEEDRRDRDRLWYTERQRRRARERELDELLESELLARSRRRLLSSSSSSRSRHSRTPHAYDDLDECRSHSRSSNCTSLSQRCHDGHSQRVCCSRHDSRRRNPHSPSSHPCCQSSSSHRNEAATLRAPAIEICATQSSIKTPRPRYPEAVARPPSAPANPRPARSSPGPSPMTGGNDHNLSVISAYLAPSPYIPSTAGFPNSHHLPLPAVSIPKSPSAVAGGIDTFASPPSRAPPGLEAYSRPRENDRYSRSDEQYRGRNADRERTLLPNPMMR
ncbi:hypothetical protein FRC02_007109 [Tulasnella sp. 418]|nr:hypothetical protein FRC02_007109 [Tulasnella sp. 418]